MAHTKLFKRFIYLLQQARRNNLQQGGLPPPVSRQAWQQSRRQFIKTATAGAVSSALFGVVPGLISYAFASRDDEKQSRIAVIGGGLAGLNAAYRLKKVGLRATVYEASSRLGGRVMTQPNLLGQGLSIEMGGEFINTDHADMLALIQDFGLSVFDRHADADTVSVPGSAYYLHGQAWSEADLVGLLQPLVAQISQDAARIDEDWDKYAPKFDKHSVSDYLDKYAGLISTPVVRTLFDNAIRTEYGVEPAESSALQLLFLLPKVDGQDVELLGYSDEAFTVQGGNSRIIEGLIHALEDQIHTGHVLSEIGFDRHGQYELRFVNGTKVEADVVILAMPFSVLRHVNVKTPLPGKLRQFIDQVDLGRNEKVITGFKERVWRQSPGFSLEAWTDLGFSEAWDGAQRQADRTDGALNYFLGGDEVKTLNNWPGGVDAAGTEFTRRLSRFVPDLQRHATGKYLRSGWTRNPYIRGAYVNYQPGQLTQFGEYLWVEADDPAERQAVHVGRLVFAGEHLSDEFYGFMNGAAQTGRLAAQFVAQKLLKPKGLTARAG